ncbi:MAG: prefoldin subunit alpha [Promethearchaeota archaeon]
MSFPNQNQPNHQNQQTPPNQNAQPNAMNQPINSQDVQQMFYIYKMLGEQEEYIGTQLNMLDKQMQGAEISRQTMKGLEETEPGQEILLPIGSMGFVKAKILDPSQVIMKINRDTFLEKKLTEALTDSDSQLKNLLEIKKKLNTELQKIQSQLAQLKPQIDRLYRASGAM